MFALNEEAVKMQALTSDAFCIFPRKTFDIERKKMDKLKKFNNENINFDHDCKTKLYLKLKQKEHSYMFNKG